MKFLNNYLVRKILILLLAVYFILGVALLALRYWAPLKINDWRPQIESQLAKKFNLDVSLDTIDLRWYGWQPSLLIKNVSLKNKNTLLKIPLLNMDIDWTALFEGYSGLIKMHVKGMDLTIARTDRTHLNILGQDLDLLGDNFNIEWLTTLLDQPYISFTDATIRWHDLHRSAPELRLDNIAAVLERDKNGDIGISLNAYLPQTSLANIQLKAHLNKHNIQKSLENLTDFDIWLSVSNFKFIDWDYWIDIPDSLTDNNANLQAWFSTKSAKRKLTVMADVTDLGYQPDDKQNIKIEKFNFWLENNLGHMDAYDLVNPSKGSDLLKDIVFELAVKKFYIHDQNIFSYPLEADRVKSTGFISHDNRLKLDLSNLLFENQDIKFDAKGSWRSDSKSETGISDFRGLIEYANLASIYKYLPNDVDQDAHDWLKHGLLSADLANGEFYLKGDVNEFPFGLKPNAGDFMVAGHFNNGKVDFIPEAKDADRWPQLYGIDGYAKLHKSSLELRADKAFMSPVKGSDITLTQLSGGIPDIEFDSVLSITGHSQASGKTYIDLIQNTPISYMLGGIFDEADASGQWQVPLSLVVPLSNSIDTQVKGSVDFSDGELQFYPIAPRITKLNGSVDFNENGINIDKAVDGVFLGGGFKLQGDLGNQNSKGLTVNGLMNAKAIADYVDLYGMRRVQGSLNYQAHLKEKSGLYTISMTSDTEKIDLDLPAPFSKPSGEKRDLNVVWSDTNNKNESLKIDYGDVIKLDLLHKSGSNKDPYFYSAAVGVQRAAKIELADGLSIDIDYPLIDLDEWDEIAKEFEKSAKPEQTPIKKRQIWPEIQLLTIQADQIRVLGTRMDRAVIRAKKKDDINWSLNINSDQTNGNVKWQYKDGHLFGTVKANFDQLSLGDDPSDTGSLLPEPKDTERPIDENINIPAMVIEANNLRIFGRSFGHLNIEGTRNSELKLWVLDRLRLGNDDTAMLKGTGTWYLIGPERGLHLNADVVLKDLGLWMTNAGWNDILAGGAGQIKGKFKWKNLPWDNNTADISGELKADLTNGRFITVNSSSAKVLQLLSLQSITRLNKLDKGLLDLTEDGFPFDQLQGNMQLEQGGVDIIDYKMTGPVATILLEGKANIIRRDMDLDAVVVPNLDVSGAAVAAGIAINPLVGLGAFVTQWLLKGPLAKSMTVRYKVSGSWDDPQTTEIPVNQE